MSNPSISAWALALITDPARAATAPKLARQRAWANLKAKRGQTCRYPWLPAPRAAQSAASGDAA